MPRENNAEGAEALTRDLQIADYLADETAGFLRAPGGAVGGSWAAKALMDAEENKGVATVTIKLEIDCTKKTDQRDDTPIKPHIVLSARYLGPREKAKRTIVDCEVGELPLFKELDLPESPDGGQAAEAKADVKDV